MARISRTLAGIAVTCGAALLLGVSGSTLSAVIFGALALFNIAIELERCAQQVPARVAKIKNEQGRKPRR